MRSNGDGIVRISRWRAGEIRRRRRACYALAVMFNDEVTPRALAPVGRLPDLAVNAMSVEVLNFALDIGVAPTTHT